MTPHGTPPTRWQVSFARMIWVATLFSISLGAWFAFSGWMFGWILRSAISCMACSAAVGLLTNGRMGAWVGAGFGFAIGAIVSAAIGFVRAIDIFTSM